ncbi:MAG: hypothetical protein IPH13_20580 [Planctomycetes bacterium]|nr:hypothetical protein [Planctomycetota bacterium]
MLTHVFLVTAVQVDPNTGRPVFIPTIHGKDATRILDLPEDMEIRDSLLAMPQEYIDRIHPDEERQGDTEVTCTVLATMTRVIAPVPTGGGGAPTVVRCVYVAEARYQKAPLIERATRVPPTTPRGGVISP